MANRTAGIYRNSTDAELRLYHVWRSSTVGIIQDRLRNEHKDQELSILTLAQGISKKLGRYFGATPAVLQTGLVDIFSDAVGIDAEMGKQRAFYEIYMPGVRSTLKFSSSAMIPAVENPCTPTDQRDTVAIVVRPLLLRKGTSSGEDYKRNSCLVKGEVWILDVGQGQARTNHRSEQKPMQSGSGERQPRALRKAPMDVGRPRTAEGPRAASREPPVGELRKASMDVGRPWAEERQGAEEAVSREY
jgi:hypothetical protein